MSRWVLVDDTDPEIRWTGSWFNDQGSQDKLGNYGLPYEDTLHGINLNGSFSYTFQGTKVLITGTIQYPSGTNTSSPFWACTVDGVAIPGFGYSTAENRLDLCETDSLNDGTHNITVEVAVSDQKTFWFDYIQYFPSLSTNLDDAALSIDSSDSQLDYGGVWESFFPGNITSQAGSNVIFSFQGVSLTWLGFYDNHLALAPTTATYSIDGQSPVVFDLDGTNAQTTGVQYNQRFFQTPQLSPGNHTIQVVYQGNSQTAPLSLCILEVQGGTSTNNTAGPSAASSAAPGATSTASVPNSTSGFSKNTGAIIGGSLAGLVLFVGLLVIFLLWRRRRRRPEAGKYEYGIIDPVFVTHDSAVGRAFVSWPFHLNNHPNSESVPRWDNNSFSTTTVGTNPYGSITGPPSNNAANRSLTSPVTAADVCPSPGNNKALEAQGRLVIANHSAPIRSEPPDHASQASDTDSMDLTYRRVVGDQDSGLRFPQPVEGRQMQVLPPDYTPT